MFDDFNNRTPSGSAVTSAISAATSNEVMHNTVSILPSDVEFPNDADGQPTEVKVSVYRQASRQPGRNAGRALLRHLRRRYRRHRHGRSLACRRRDLRQALDDSDRWIERQTSPWDINDTFSAYPKNPSLQPDVYVPTGSASYTGYDMYRDKGLELVLKAGSGSQIAPSFYYSFAIPDSMGGDDYDWNIANCNTTVMTPNQLITAEPGDKVGPTKHGVEDLIARDPGAYWDTTNNKVVSDMHPSPRLIVIPVFDPFYYDTGKHEGRTADLKAANYIGFFLEDVSGAGDVRGRITPVTGIRTGGPTPVGFFPKTIRLVK